ncbi:MAG TPA: hypothetical protein VL860_08375, partial [Planctomycetota bacterium]|nr:hypothetical protein [Planctomycetota bacterium]
MHSHGSCIRKTALCTMFCALFLLVAGDLHAAQSVAARNIKMRRSDMPDTSDIDTVLASILTAGMTDEQKAKAIWKFAMSMRHQDSPPTEQICDYPTDGIKVFNVYGYNYCSMVAGAIGALADRAGLPQRQRGIRNHNVMEIYYSGAWHMFDGSLINYYYDTDNVTIASVDSLIANRLTIINQAHCPYFDSNDWYPALTHNKAGALTEYDGSSNVVLTDGVGSGYQIGYKCLLNLREGETLT